MQYFRPVRNFAALVCLTVATACAPQAVMEQAAMERGEIPLPLTGRSVVNTEMGIVATNNPLASSVGVQILEQGGNAIDAAIAANSALALMDPTSNGIGGDLFAIIYLAETEEIFGLNASGWSPAALSAEYLKELGHESMPRRGIHSVTVPGVIAGWDAMRERFGNLDFGTILAPAIWYAENGFPIHEVTGRMWAGSVDMHQQHPNSAHTYLVDGERAPKVGEVFRNPDLANTLRRIVADGRDGYYKGPTAEAIIAISDEFDGTMTLDDLAEYEPEWTETISTTYRDWTVHEMPPNGQGIAALMMLDLMENFPLGEYGFHSPEALHVMIESKKLAYADMITYVGDPRFAKVPVEGMLDKERARERARLIDMDQAMCSVEPSRFVGLDNEDGGDTIYLTTIDKDGNIVSYIQSNYSGFGSGLVPPGTGFMLHNRGALFTLDESHPNVLEGHKRPLNTIIPGLMVNNEGGERIGFGIMGGFNQPQAHAQFIANIVDYGMNIQQAHEAGRFTKGSFDGCDVNMEVMVPEWVRAELTALGHEINVRPPRTGGFGYGQAVMGDGTGVHYGASEPRHDGMAMPQPAPVFANR